MFSYGTLIKILGHLKRICNVDKANCDGLRKWLNIPSDGVPFNLASNTQDNILTCKTRGLEIDKKF